MRAIAILLIAAGIGGAFLYPALVSRHSGEEVARAPVFDRAQGGWQGGWRSAPITLDPEANPMRLVVEAEFLPTTNRFDTTTGLAISLSSGGQTVLEGSFDLPVPLPQLGGSERQTRASSLVTPEFDVEEAGEFVVTVRSEEPVDMNFQRVDIAVRGRVAMPDSRFRLSGAGAIGLGLVMLLVAARRRREPLVEFGRSRWGARRK